MSDSHAALAAQFLDPDDLPLNQQTMLRTVLKDPVICTALRLHLRPGEIWEENKIMKERGLVVGVIIALQEELDYYLETLEEAPEPDISKITGAAYFIHKIAIPGGSQLTLVVRLAGKGPENAAIAATQILIEYNPAFLVNIGMSGKLDDDISLSSVVVGNSITAWAANARIEDTDRGDFSFRPAGDPYRADKWLSDRAAGLREESSTIYAEWERIVRQLISKKSPSYNIMVPKVVRGDLAAGPFVSASAAFKRWLSDHKRDYLAIDMESSGVATAIWSDAVRRTRLLVLRGISDPADMDKARLDKENKGLNRHLAMCTVTYFLFAVLRHIASLELPS